jgi:hypothetical protein
MSEVDAGICAMCVKFIVASAHWDNRTEDDVARDAADKKKKAPSLDAAAGAFIVRRSRHGRAEIFLGELVKLEEPKEGKEDKRIWNGCYGGTAGSVDVEDFAEDVADGVLAIANDTADKVVRASLTTWHQCIVANKKKGSTFLHALDREVGEETCGMIGSHALADMLANPEGRACVNRSWDKGTFRAGNAIVELPHRMHAPVDRFMRAYNLAVETTGVAAAKVEFSKMRWCDLENVVNACVAAAPASAERFAEAEKVAKATNTKFQLDKTLDIVHVPDSDIRIPGYIANTLALSADAFAVFCKGQPAADVQMGDAQEEEEEEEKVDLSVRCIFLGHGITFVRERDLGAHELAFFLEGPSPRTHLVKSARASLIQAFAVVMNTRAAALAAIGVTRVVLVVPEPVEQVASEGFDAEGLCDDDGNEEKGELSTAKRLCLTADQAAVNKDKAEVRAAARAHAKKINGGAAVNLLRGADFNYLDNFTAEQAAVDDCDGIVVVVNASEDSPGFCTRVEMGYAVGKRPHAVVVSVPEGAFNGDYPRTFATFHGVIAQCNLHLGVAADALDKAIAGRSAFVVHKKADGVVVVIMQEQAADSIHLKHAIRAAIADNAITFISVHVPLAFVSASIDMLLANNFEIQQLAESKSLSFVFFKV